MNATAWQPIATAPRDGTRVLLLRDKCWRERMAVGFFYAAFDDWCEPSTAIFVCPTHWQPLPPPPAQATTDDNGGGDDGD